MFLMHIWHYYNQITISGGAGIKMATKRRDQEGEPKDIPDTGDKEFFILGVMRDQKREEHARQHEVVLHCYCISIAL